MGGHTLQNPKTGEIITFLKTSRDTHGELFQMSYTRMPHAAIVDEHSHPSQEMRIKVLSGTLTCTIDGTDKKIRAGEEAIIPAGVPHFQRNDCEEKVYAVEEYRPALQIEEFFEVLVGWANDGRTNEAGLPNLLRLAVLERCFRQCIRSSSEKRNFASRLLAPIGIALGYQREVESYIRSASQKDR